MIKSSNRITQKEFLLMFKAGKRVQSAYFTMIFGVLSDINTKIPFKSAVVVPKSISKKAVDRNKLKRRMYSLIKKNIKSLQNKGFYIFLLKKEAKTAVFKDLQISVEKALKSV